MADPATLQSLTSALSAAGIAFSRYDDRRSASENVTGRSYSAIGAVRPRSAAEVKMLVETARALHVPLYPVSTGLNWGYGSRSPTRPDSLIVELGAMNSILNADEISLENPVAVIEAGVTQRQLHDFLARRCPALGFNVTGAAADTSIIGNSLDRGVGYLGPRKEDLFGLEVVTGTGALLQTGFRRLGPESPLAHTHPFGLGPMLDGLFFQGNFGIVTSACFRLHPRRPMEVGVSLALRREADLAPFVDELAHLKRDGLLTSVTHLGNRARTHATLSYGIARYLEEECGLSREAAMEDATRALAIVAPYEWTALASVTGNKGQVKAAVREIRRRTQAFARLMVITDTVLDLGEFVTHRLRSFRFFRAYAAAIAATRPLHRLALGVPTDVAIENLLWKFDISGGITQLDRSRCGLLFINPALPMDGAFVLRLFDEMRRIANAHGQTLYITLNFETPTSLVAVVNLLFDRSIDDEMERAHACADALLDCIHANGLEVYRARADMMNSLVTGDSDYWQTVAAIKRALDPDGIIAPGRYERA